MGHCVGSSVCAASHCGQRYGASHNVGIVPPPGEKPRFGPASSPTFSLFRGKPTRIKLLLGAVPPLAIGRGGTSARTKSLRWVRLVGTPNSPPVSLAIRLHMWISARRLKIETRNRSRLRLLIVARTVLARERERETACE